MGFMLDMLAEGRRFRVLTLVDYFSREHLAIEVAPSIPGERVARGFDTVIDERATPAVVVSDKSGIHGSHARSVGEPEQKEVAFHPAAQTAERLHRIVFNGTFREECLNASWLVDSAHARAVNEVWTTR